MARLTRTSRAWVSSVTSRSRRRAGWCEAVVGRRLGAHRGDQRSAAPDAGALAVAGDGGLVASGARRSVSHAIAATAARARTITMTIDLSLATGELTGQFFGRCNLPSFFRISRVAATRREPRRQASANFLAALSSRADEMRRFSAGETAHNRGFSARQSQLVSVNFTYLRGYLLNGFVGTCMP